MNKAVKSVVMVLGIGAFLQVFGVASATWTGAENGFWTNANNWGDGQIAGRIARARSRTADAAGLAALLERPGAEARRPPRHPYLFSLMAAGVRA